MRDAVPVALPHEPTTLAWDRRVDAVMVPLSDTETVRVSPVMVSMTGTETVRVEDSGETVKMPAPFCVHLDDESDGIPQSLELETSSSVAIVLPDLLKTFEILEMLARARKVRMSILPVERDAKTAAIVQYDTAAILRLSGHEKIQRSYKALVVTVFTWTAFKHWLPKILRDAEQMLFRTFDVRKATAMKSRLRAFAENVSRHQPPQGNDYDVLHVE